MVRHDYRQEIGLDPAATTVPWPYALLILALLATGVAWFTSAELRVVHRSHDQTPAALVTQIPTPTAHAPMTAQTTPRSGGGAARHPVS